MRIFLGLARKLRSDRDLMVFSALSGLGLFGILMAWLDYHGYFVSPDAIYMNILAKSLWENPYVIWFKRAFSYKYEIVHHDFNFPPIGPILHWIFEAAGVTTWHRGNWITAFFMGMTVSAWIWALSPHFENPDDPSKPSFKTPKEWRLQAALAGWAATLILFAQARNQMWHELYLGIVSPVAVMLYILSYGAYIRERYVLCGALTGIAFLVRFDAQVTLAILVLGHILSRLPLREREDWKRVIIQCLKMGLTFLAVTSPWWIRSMSLGYPPWFNHMVPIFLYGEAGNFRWFPDTDTAIGHPINNQPPYVFFEYLVRQRWYDLIVPYLGPFASEFALLGLLIFLGFLYALRRPRQRALVAFVWIGAILRVSVIAGLHDSFNRRYFLIFDACAITWIALMLWDSNRWIRNAARLVVILLVMTNWNDLTRVLKTMRPYVGYLEGHSPGLAAAVKHINVGKEPVLADQIAGHAIAYFTEKTPIIELPTNYNSPGIMDQFVKRWKIKWATNGDTIKPHLKEHDVEAVRAPNGYVLWKVIPKAQ